MRMIQRAGLSLVVLIASLGLAVAAGLPPSPKPAIAPPATFSAARALADIRAIAGAPHVTGSAESARVRAYLSARLAGMGFQVSQQASPLSDQARGRLTRWDEPPAADAQAINVIGVLPASPPSWRRCGRCRWPPTVAATWWWC